MVGEKPALARPLTHCQGAGGEVRAPCPIAVFDTDNLKPAGSLNQPPPSTWNKSRSTTPPAADYGLGSGNSTGPPCSAQVENPSRRWAQEKPIPFRVATVSAERQPEAQWNTNFFSSPKIGLK